MQMLWSTKTELVFDAKRSSQCVLASLDHPLFPSCFRRLYLIKELFILNPLHPTLPLLSIQGEGQVCPCFSTAAIFLFVQHRISPRWKTSLRSQFRLIRERAAPTHQSGNLSQYESAPLRLQSTATILRQKQWN